MSRASLSAGWGKWSKTPVNVPGPSGGDKLPIAKLQDVFPNGGATLDQLWTSRYGTLSVTDGRARATCDTGYSAFVSAGIYTLENSLVYAQVFPSAQNGATSEASTEMFVLSGTAGTDLGFFYDAVSGNLSFLDRSGYFDGGGTNITYNSTTHRYWRIVSYAGVIYWDTSPDGITWTERRNKPGGGAAWIANSNLALSLQTHRSDGVANFAEFDNVNAIPVLATMVAGSGSIAPTLSAVRGRHGVMVAGPFSIAPTLLAETISPDIISDPYVLITNEDLEVVGDPISAFEIDVVQNFNAPDSGSFKAVAYPDVIDQFQPGNRAVIMVDGEVFTSGPIEKPGGYEWAVGGEEEPGTITINFAGDESSIAGRLTYPNPAQTATTQTSAYYEATANAETVIRNLVNLNCGPGALATRRIPNLIMGDVAGVGSSVVVKTRFESVTEVSRALAISGGGLGFRTRQVGTDIVFSVYAPEDKSGIARFSRGLGNLISVKYEISKPTATTVIVGGEGEAEVRTIVERTNSGEEGDWGRVEQWVNSSSQDAGSGGLDQAGDEALAANGEEVQLATVTIDTGDVRYGKHYGLGDLATVEVYEGVELTETVRSAHFTYTPEEGKQISILVGSQEATRDPEWLRITQRLAGRLGRLERT